MIWKLYILFIFALAKVDSIIDSTIASVVAPKCREIDTLETPKIIAGVVELVDTLDLGSSAARCESSSLSARTFNL